MRHGLLYPELALNFRSTDDLELLILLSPPYCRDYRRAPQDQSQALLLSKHSTNCATAQDPQAIFLVISS